MAQYDFDLFVIGAGSGGVRAARMSAAQGARVAVAEERYLGGTCVNVGCVPKKLFVYASHYSHDFRDAQQYGWDINMGELDWIKLRDAKTAEIQRLNGIYENLLNNAGCEIITGKAIIEDAHTVSVGDKRYTAEKLLIATGGWPWVPDFPGNEHVITSNEVFYMERLPKKPVVVGGGYIALEFAGIFEGMGCESHLIYRGPRILKRFDREVGDIVHEEIRKKHINLHLENDIVKIEKRGDYDLLLTLKDGSTLESDCVLYATGRTPIVEGIGLNNIDVKIQPNGKIQVNEFFETTEPGVYAIGDIIDGPELTPVALAEGMAFAKTQYGNEPTTVNYHDIATAVFCQPNIGTVGLSEEEAREQYTNIKVFGSRFRALKHTLTDNQEKTFMKMIVDADSDKVLGVHMVGPEAGEIIQGIAVAIKAGAKKADFDATIGIHPTAAEEFVTMRDAREG
jgi:glutathione reductase (NADPH)